jgi:GT2 family glycosyltransferase
VTAETVDVGIVTYNTRDVTLRTLERLADVSTPNLRVLVHDNASTDDTAAAVRRRFPEVEVSVGGRNLGFAAGMNALLRTAGAPWFLALNSDAWPQPGAIDRLLDAARHHPRAAAVAPRLQRPDGTLEHSTHPFPSLVVAAAGAAGVGQRVGSRWGRRHLLHGAWAHDEPTDVDWAVGAALLLRRTAIEDIGLFDERFFMYAEDLDWCWRAADHGWTIRFEPSAVVTHIGNASGASVYESRRTAAWIRNSALVYRSHHGAWGSRAHQVLEAAGALHAATRGALARDRPRARYWLDAARWHLTPLAATDRPD